MQLVCCADFGSTFTKTLLVSLDDSEVVAAAEHPTTIDTDVLNGLRACLDQLARAVPGAVGAPVLACSSAGGGLRIAVVGNEDLVTAEAGRRVALSSGGRVVHVGSGGLDVGRLAALRASEPDVVLLVGGTDGGNADVLVQSAEALRSWHGPVVVAGNAAATGRVTAILDAGQVPYDAADNVVPRIGVLAPESARASIRAAFLRHVIGGKHLSSSEEFIEMVTGPTPDVVLTGAEMLADLVGDVTVVDVGGATTDVHSVVDIDSEDAELSRQVVAPTRVTRTVEADLGMRWSAQTTIEQGVDTGVLSATEADGTVGDLRLAEVAVAIAMRRHTGRQRVVLGTDGRVVERTGKDLREIRLLVGSGGVLRHARTVDAELVLRASTGPDVEGGWLLPRSPRLVVDRAYVLAAVGLLAPSRPEVVTGLLRRHLAPGPPGETAADTA